MGFNFQKKQSNKFTGFIDPFLNLIDNGVIYRKGFAALYWISAVVCLLSPLILLQQAISGGVLKMLSGNLLFIFLAIWISSVFPCWLGFQVYWNRMKKINTLLKEEDDFVAIPLVADCVKTCGEFICVTSVGSVPFMILLGVFAAKVEEIQFFLSMLGGMTAFLGFGTILMVILGYVSMLGAKFLAEMITALASIANNTKTVTEANFTAKSRTSSGSTQTMTAAEANFTAKSQTSSGSTQMPTFKKRVRAEITDEIRKSGVNGTVIVRVLVGSDGKAKDAIALNDLGFGTSQSAIAACMQMEFNPARIGDEIAEMWIKVPVRFENL